MSTTNLNIRIDKETKEQADRLFIELGLNMSSAIIIFLRTVIRENGIPFDIRLNTPIVKTKEKETVSENNSVVEELAEENPEVNNEEKLEDKPEESQNEEIETEENIEEIIETEESPSEEEKDNSLDI